MSMPSEWFASQLSSSADGFTWAARQVTAERLYKQPPRGLGEWSAARHVFHLRFYEQTLALPGMQQWLGAPIPGVDDAGEDSSWTGSEHIDDLLVKFHEIRSAQIALLPQFKQADWDRSCDTIWGPVTLFWVVAKTYQHTNEHISDVLRIALFWERAARVE